MGPGIGETRAVILKRKACAVVDLECVKGPVDKQRGEVSCRSFWDLSGSVGGWGASPRGYIRRIGGSDKERDGARYLSVQGG